MTGKRKRGRPNGERRRSGPIPEGAAGLPSEARHAHRVLAAGLAIYLAILAAMVAFDSYTFVLKSAVIPFLLAAALLSGRFAGFVNDWAVFLGLVVLFDSLRSLVYAATTNFELPMYAVYAIEWERWLMRGAVAPVALQQWRAGLADPLWLDRFFVLLHASHFLVFLLFGFVLWTLRRDVFRTYAVAMMAVLYLGLLIQALVPTVPPWLAAGDFLLLPQVTRVIRSVYNVHLPTVAAMFDINPIAAMPSLHAAMPALCALFALRYWGPAGLVVGGYALGVWVAAIYLGEHYLVDVLAGGALALAIHAGVRRWGAPADRLVAESGAGSREGLAPRPIAIAVVLVVGAFGLAQLSTAWFAPLPITRQFVDRELVGRSPMAHYVLGRMAFDAGNRGEARVHLTRALAELSHPEEQKVIRSYLDQTGPPSGAP